METDMRGVVGTIALLATAPAWAMQGSPDPVADMVVTGRPLADTRRALDACIARRCPPKDDIAVTVAHTENLFVAGAYADAQSVAAAGIRRNKRHARQLPVDVAGLLRAHARLSAHLGEGTLFRGSMLDMMSALRAGLPDDDARVLGGRIELADAFAKLGKLPAANADYLKVAADARTAGNRTIEAYALFRRAMTYAGLAQSDAGYTGRARQALQDLTGSTVPEHAVFASAAQLIAARMAVRDGDKAEIERIVADYRNRPATARPTLLYGEPVRLIAARQVDDGGSATRLLATEDVEDHWIDVAFLVDRSGAAQEVETIRTSDGYAGGWADAVSTAIKSRRYAPLALPAGSPGLFRVERYTKTAPYISVTGTRMRSRSPVATIEMLDLSTDAPPPRPTAAKG